MEYDRDLTDTAGEQGGARLPPLLWFLGEPWTAPQFPVVIVILSLYRRAVKRGVPMLQIQIELTSLSVKLFVNVRIRPPSALSVPLSRGAASAG